MTDTIVGTLDAAETETAPEVGLAVVDFYGPFTFDEIVSIEGLVDIPFSRWFDGTTLEGELRRAIAWTYALRVDPDASLASFGSFAVSVPREP